jgi:hypothetical protein
MRYSWPKTLRCASARALRIASPDENKIKFVTGRNCPNLFQILLRFAGANRAAVAQ